MNIFYMKVWSKLSIIYFCMPIADRSMHAIM